MLSERSFGGEVRAETGGAESMVAALLTTSQGQRGFSESGALFQQFGPMQAELAKFKEVVPLGNVNNLNIAAEQRVR